MIEPWTGAPWQPRDWQFYALPEIVKHLKAGKKPIVSATMGAGKSVVIAELCWMALQKLKPDRRIIVAAPRQHLVKQLAATIGKRCGEEKVGCFFTHAKETNRPIIVCCFASAAKLSIILTDINISMLIGDEVHGTESDHFKDAYKKLVPACAVGFTATPFRSNKNQTLTLWDSVAYRYTTKDALEDGVIVPWKLVHWDGDNFKAEQVDEICLSLIKKYGRGCGIVNATSIEDAKGFAAFLRANNVSAKCVHSGLSAEEQHKRIEQLRIEAIQVIVHVNMLSEGVDFPFLRWLCMRRPVGARVRFCQEVGRVLRSHPGKKEAIIMDPHDLFNQHGLIYQEALGELLIEKSPDEEMLAKLDIEAEDLMEEFKTMRPAVAVGNIESWVRGIITAMRANGLAKPPYQEPQVEETNSENKPTKKQLTTLQNVKWATRYLPESHRKDVQRLLDESRAATLSKNTISDLLSICFALAKCSNAQRKRHRHWHFPQHVVLPQTRIPVQGLLFVSDR
jgi:superfamily II DNA or RNA helicase